MSKAYTIDTTTIKERKRNNRTPEETRFLGFFGATNLYNSYANGLDMLSVQDSAMGFQASMDIPLPMDAPLQLGMIPLASVPEHREIRLPVKEPVLHDSTGYVVQATEAGDDLNEGDRAIEKNDAQLLVEFLEEMGQKVHEVKALPAGVTRITVADLIGAQKAREPELVMAGGRQ
jgi:hypothetical protein